MQAGISLFFDEMIIFVCFLLIFQRFNDGKKDYFDYFCHSIHGCI